MKFPKYLPTLVQTLEDLVYSRVSSLGLKPEPAVRPQHPRINVRSSGVREMGTMLHLLPVFVEAKDH